MSEQQDRLLREVSLPRMGALLAGKYRINRLLAEGGMGSVFHAVQEPLGRDVAVKTLKSEGNLPQNKIEERTRRFFREASLCSRLNHPNTITIFDYGQLTDGGFFLAMEYLEGYTLRDLLNNERALDVEVSLHIAAQIASSLADAHKAGVVHRDLKPPNIMLVERGGDPYFVKVVDFGLIKEVGATEDEELTADNVVLGSPLYMAPERFMEKGVDIPAIDVYALGITLYEMLCGRPPFVRPPDSTMHRLILSHAQEEPPAMRTFAPHLQLPDGLESLVMRCLAKLPDERPTMEAVVHLLRACLKASGNAQYAGYATGPISRPAPQPAPPRPDQDTSDRLIQPVPHTSELTRPTPLRQGSGEQPFGGPPVSAPHLQPQLVASSVAAASVQQRAEGTWDGPAPSGQGMSAPQTSSRAPLIAIAIAALLAVALGGVYVMTRPPAQIELAIASEPAGAEVWRGGERLGVTPLSTTVVYEGPATLELRLDGYQPYSYRMPSANLGAARVDASLVPLAAPPKEVTPPVEVKEARDSRTSDAEKTSEKPGVGESADGTSKVTKGTTKVKVNPNQKTIRNVPATDSTKSSSTDIKQER